MWPLSPLPPPPIPQLIKEYLGDYPDLLEKLQLALNDVVLKPVHSEPPFEVAIWALEDGLSGFFCDAQDRLRAAIATGDAAAIAQAERRESATGYARSSGHGMKDLREIERYFEENRGALR
ncbi:hypothetical protein L2Y96_20320 [Luteibacter aegosomaticola]|jgi:hypothetical protein|uniref:hypothetical protein n=1 Tax=Luteibacter aegosomaticola TaxID=2911538 RepID=UPI001FF96CF7|nr:hypothetical protein [Luteibacter aegosomaticola]UPG89706.1 hypothetical protein L2Y96_20320 [Luteibacter aegosomaticola]